MTTSLNTTSSTDLQTVVDDNLLSDYLKSMGLAKKLNQDETAQFLQIAKAYQLNPFKREIYATKYEGNAQSFSIIVGYETYLKRAERSGKLNGWEVTFSEYEDGEFSATITIYRKDWDRPFSWEVFYSEQVQTTRDGKVTKFWSKKRQQLRKVAISQGMRLAFPDENGGLPYTSDEMPSEVQDTEHEVVAETKVIEPAKAKTTGKRATAQAMKDYQETGKLPDVVDNGDPVPDEQFVFDRIDEFEGNIKKAEDDPSFDWNEQMIADDKLLSLDDKRKLIKASIIRRIGLVTNPDAANYVRGRIAKYQSGLAEEVNVLFQDLKEQAETNGMCYNTKGKHFEPIAEEPTNEQFSQALADNG
ncbi:hypothetical protein GCM10028805_22740 [Spirosoma harenae]